MRILVLGRNGQLAASLCDCATRVPGIELVAVGRPEVDVEVPASLEDVIGHVRPDLVVNASAYTAVDKAESDEDRAHAVNCRGAGNAAAASARRGLPFIHLSTDYVFPGDKAEPYVESDQTGPLGVYGRTKLAGEHRVLDAHPSPLILRTSWVYSPFGTNFVRTMLKLGAERPVLRVVSDQHGNPTSALDLASAILRIAPGLTRGGTYDLCGSAETTWHGFARDIFAIGQVYGGPDPLVEPITTEQYPTPALRPANSRLSTDAFAERFGFRPGSWHSGLHPVLARLLSGVSPIPQTTAAGTTPRDMRPSQMFLGVAARESYS